MAGAPSAEPEPEAPEHGERARRDLDRSLGDGGMPLLAELGVDFDAYGEGSATAAWVPTDLACNPAGIVQGGVYGVIHDAAMNFAVNSALERGDRAATLDVQYQTRRAATAGDGLRVRGAVTQLTRQIAYVECVVRDADDRVVSQATATFMVRRREEGKA
jgi:uncharacterized protein (TIGR00369 family)